MVGLHVVKSPQVGACLRAQRLQRPYLDIERYNIGGQSGYVFIRAGPELAASTIPHVENECLCVLRGLLPLRMAFYYVELRKSGKKIYVMLGRLIFSPALPVLENSTDARTTCSGSGSIFPSVKPTCEPSLAQCILSVINYPIAENVDSIQIL